MTVAVNASPREVVVQGMSSVALALSVLGPVGPATPNDGQSAPPSGSAVQTRTSHAPDLVVVLKDGTRVWLAEDSIVPGLREGATFTLSYEKRAGKHVVTSIEAAE